MSRLKTHFIRVIITIIVLLLSSRIVALADNKDLLGQYDFTEVSFSYGTGLKVNNSSISDTTGFVYNDGFLLMDNTVMSPELAKVSVGLSVAVYDEGNLDNVVSQLPGYEYVVKKNYDIEHTLSNNDFVRYAILKKSNVEYNGALYTILCVPVQGTKSGYDWNSDFM